MAFKNVGSIVFLAPGATATWNYSYGMDMGPQFACADIKFMGRGGHNPAPSPVFRADNQCKQLQRSGNATYYVNITNESAYGGYHNLQGGGLT